MLGGNMQFHALISYIELLLKNIIMNAFSRDYK